MSGFITLFARYQRIQKARSQSDREKVCDDLNPKHPKPRQLWRVLDGAGSFERRSSLTPHRAQNSQSGFRHSTFRFSREKLFRDHFVIASSLMRFVSKSVKVFACLYVCVTAQAAETNSAVELPKLKIVSPAGIIGMSKMWVVETAGKRKAVIFSNLPPDVEKYVTNRVAVIARIDQLRKFIPEERKRLRPLNDAHPYYGQVPSLDQANANLNSRENELRELEEEMEQISKQDKTLGFVSARFTGRTFAKCEVWQVVK